MADTKEKTPLAWDDLIEVFKETDMLILTMRTGLTMMEKKFETAFEIAPSILVEIKAAILTCDDNAMKLQDIIKKHSKEIEGGKVTPYIGELNLKEKEHVDVFYALSMEYTELKFALTDFRNVVLPHIIGTLNHVVDTNNIELTDMEMVILKGKQDEK